MLNGRDIDGVSHSRILDGLDSCRSTPMNVKGAPPKVYEELIQKLEADIRMHIRIEQQMRIHIENLQNKVEELERNKDK